MHALFMTISPLACCACPAEKAATAEQRVIVIQSRVFSAFRLIETAALPSFSRAARLYSGHRCVSPHTLDLAVEIFSNWHCWHRSCPPCRTRPGASVSWNMTTPNRLSGRESLPFPPRFKTAELTPYERPGRNGFVHGMRRFGAVFREERRTRSRTLFFSGLRSRRCPV